MKTPAHFGENFSNEQLMALPMNEIEAHFKTQSENFSQGPVVQPGKGIPFLIVFRNVPQGAGEFGADVLRSTVVSP